MNNQAIPLKNNTTDADIVIIGAGIVGCTLACLLAQKTSLRITLIDKTLKTKENFFTAPDYDSRVSAISVASENIFKLIGAWEPMTQIRTSPFKKMFVWDSSTTAHIEFKATDFGERRLGHLIENRVMLNALLSIVKKSPHIMLMENIEPESISKKNEHSFIQFNNGLHLKTTWIVGADGASSWVREKASIEWQEKEYGHTAIVCSLTTEHSHEQTAWQCFTPEGPIAFLPFPDEHHASLVWSNSPERARYLMSLNDDDFQKELAKNFEYKLGKILTVSTRHAFSLKRAEAKNYVKNNIILVGDAAHTIHPLAGQGLNLGLMDAATLAETFITKKELHHYERVRKSETWLMMQAMDEFKRLFCTRNFLARTLRYAGLLLADHCSPLKKMLARRAMGLAGDMPEFLKHLE